MGIRTTFLAHNKASAYILKKDARAFGMKRLRQDLTFKILQTGAREYQAGLMLHQKPYVIVGKRDMPIVDKIWVEHISAVLDIVTQSGDVAEEVSSRSGSDDDMDKFYDDEEFGASYVYAETKPKHTKGKGKGKDKGKDKSTDKGGPGDKGRKGKGK